VALPKLEEKLTGATWKTEKPYLAMTSYFTFPSAFNCTARALEVLAFSGRPIDRGNCATVISG
jgi:hypothetical protein